MGFDPGARNTADLIKSNMSDFTYAYIKDHKLICNDSKINSSTTAKYSAVDIGAGNVPTQMICKCIFGAGTQSGTVALISNPNGRSAINNITTGSLHIIFKANQIAVQVWDNSVLTTIGQYYFTQFPLDNTTEVQFDWSVSGNTLTAHANNITYTLTDSRIPTHMGRYCTLEHWYNSPFGTVGRPQFTYFEVNGTGFESVKDDFKRNDGAIGVSTSGHTYYLLSEFPG